MTIKAITTSIRGWFGGTLLLGSVLPLSAALVTFEANMSYQADLGNFTPGVDGVEAHGSFNSWGTLVLTNVPGTTNYRNTLEIAGAAGASYELKFVNTRPGAPNGGWESGGNRRFQLTDGPLLVSRYYNDEWAGGDYTVTLTFQVSMLPKILTGDFDPAVDTVEIKGSYNGWGPGVAMTNNTADPVNPNLYSMTIEWIESRAPGAPLEYKFHTYGVHDAWEGDPNRAWPMAATTETLPLDCFNRVCSVPVKARIFFQVDMRAQLISNFDTNAEAAYVRGNVLGWGGGEGLPLVEDAARPGFFTNTWTKDNQLVGEKFEYKYVIYDLGLGSTKWEDGANKSLSFSGTEPVDTEGYHLITLPASYWNNISPYDLLPADTEVTFQVSMTNAVGFGGSPVFDPVADMVTVNGSFVPWWTWSMGAGAEYQLSTNGSGSQVYSYTQTFVKGKPVKITYKYSINGFDNEAAVGQDHVRYIRTTGSYTLPLDVFGHAEVESEVGSLTIGPPSGGNVLLKWNGRPGVHLQSKAGLGSGGWTDDWSTEGLSSKSVPVGTAQFFRLVKP